VCCAVTLLHNPRRSRSLVGVGAGVSPAFLRVSLLRLADWRDCIHGVTRATHRYGIRAEYMYFHLSLVMKRVTSFGIGRRVTSVLGEIAPNPEQRLL
jgi:hypothetical protein